MFYACHRFLVTAQYKQFRISSSWAIACAYLVTNCFGLFAYMAGNCFECNNILANSLLFIILLLFFSTEFIVLFHSFCEIDSQQKKIINVIVGAKRGPENSFMLRGRKRKQEKSNQRSVHTIDLCRFLSKRNMSCSIRMSVSSMHAINFNLFCHFWKAGGTRASVAGHDMPTRQFQFRKIFGTIYIYIHAESMKTGDIIWNLSHTRIWKEKRRDHKNTASHSTPCLLRILQIENPLNFICDVWARSRATLASFQLHKYCHVSLWHRYNVFKWLCASEGNGAKSKNKRKRKTQAEE